MKNGLRIVGLIGLVLLIGSPYGSVRSEDTPQAVDILVQAFENTNKAKNYRLKEEINIEITCVGKMIQDIDFILEGIYKTPDLLYLNSEIKGMSIEMYGQGKDVVIKNPNTDKWLKRPKEQISFIPLESIQIRKADIKEAKVTKSEKIKGKDCQIIEAVLTQEGLKELLSNRVPNLSGGAELEFTEVTFKVWIDNSENLIYKTSLSIEATSGEASLMPFILPYETDNDPEARNILIKAFKNSEQMKSCRTEGKMKVQTTTNQGNMEMAGTMKAIYKAPDMKTEIAMMGMSQEIYGRGNSVVMKNPMTGEWAKLPVGTKGQISALPGSQMPGFEEHIKGAKFAGNEIINGKECQTIEASFTPEGLQEMLQRQTANLPKGMTIKCDKASFKYWVDKNENLIQKTIIYMETETVMNVPGQEKAMTMSSKIGMEVNLFDYDKELKLEIPDEVEKLLKGDKEPEEKPRTRTLEITMEGNYSDYDKELEIKIPDEVREIMKGSEK